MKFLSNFFFNLFNSQLPVYLALICCICEFRYLKERNAKLELEQKEKAEQEKLAELRGLKDPKCPPGHMLMPQDELQKQLTEMKTGICLE